MPARYLLKLIIFLMLGIPTGFPLFVSAQLPDREAFATMTVPELFDVGSADTGWWAMRGMPWPINELVERPREEVVAEAVRRIQEPGVGTYTDAFLVQVLIRLDSDDLDAILLSHYEALDELGRYEVLLYATENYLPGFAVHFRDAVSRAQDDPELSRVAVLAALYQSVVADPGLQEVLSQYVSLHAGSEGDGARSMILDGFPYSDVIAMQVDDVDTLFRRALRIGEQQLSLGNPPMTPAETAQLGRIRNSLLQPERKTLDMQQDSLAEVLQQLGREFPGFRVDSLSRELRSETVQASITGADLSLADALGQLCNEHLLRILPDILEENAWAISPSNSNGYGATNNCVAVDGFLISLTPYLWEFRDGPMISLSVTVGSSSTWFNATQTRFHIEPVVTQQQPTDTNGQPLPARIPSSIMLGDLAPEELGAVTVHGTLELTLPTSLKTIAFDLRGQTSLTVEQGIRRLLYSETPDQVSVSWGLSATCCNWLSPPFLTDPGKVVLRDEQGNIPSLSSVGLGSSWGNRAGSSQGFRRDDRNPWRPATLNWTYAPTVETLSIPVSFENMRLIPRVEATR